MKFLLATLLSAAVVVAAGPATAQTVRAQTGMSKGLAAPTYRSALYWNQTITLAGELTSTAKTGAVATANGAFGINTNVNTVPGASVAVLPKAGGLAGTVSRESALQAIGYWHDSAAQPFINQISTYLRAKGISQGYFNFSQEVNISTATGVRKQIIAWSGFVESSGRAVYGKPKLADPDPTLLEVVYWSRKADSELPEHWTYNEAGKLSYRVMNYKFEPLTNWTHLDTAGAFDEPDDEQSTDSHAIKCLVDTTGLTGCPSNPNVRKLMAQTGSTGAVLTYVRQLEPVYVAASDDPDSEEVEPVTAYSYDDRVWMCDKLENSGSFGYLLQGAADMFLVTESSPRYTHLPLAQTPFEAISASEPFKVQATKAELGTNHPAAVLLSPFKDKAIWRIPSPEASKAVNIAPIRVNPTEGTASMSPISSDVYLSKVVNGNVVDYTIGTVGSNYFGGGIHTRTVTFNLENKDELEEFRLLSSYWDDHLMITLNGHVMYIGPEHSVGTHYNIGDTGFGYFSNPQDYCYATEGGDSCYSFDLGGIGIAAQEEPTSCLVLKHDYWGEGGYSYYETVDNRGPYVNGIHQGKGLCPKYTKVVKGKALQRWEWSRTWGVSNNLDMRPWLVNGENRIDVLLVVGGRGEFWFNIREKRQSCGETLGISEGAQPLLGGARTDVNQQLEQIRRNRFTQLP
jgi:hypothetical protein